MRTRIAWRATIRSVVTPAVGAIRSRLRPTPLLMNPKLRPPLRLSLALAALIAAALRAVGAEPAAAIAPRNTVALFNGKDLSNFYTWLAPHGREDPDKVFTVVDQIDGAPAIRMSGQHYGGIVTKERYTNYRLVTEFRWGTITWEPRLLKTRDSGILFHCQGEDGNYAKDFRAPWLRSVEYQIIEGGTGDIIIVGGYDRGGTESIYPTLKATVTPGTKIWNPVGVVAEFGRGKNRVDWGEKDPQWKDVPGFRGARDAEKPVGEWNRIEVICDGGSLTYFLNGRMVNAVTDCSVREGKLLFQSEAAEIFFRKIELHPLKK